MKYSKIIDEDLLDIVNYCTPKLLINKLKKKTVLITGASGMIGSYFVYTILKLNEMYHTNTKIIAIVRNLDKLDPFIIQNNNVMILNKDVTERLEIKDEINYIIHAASPASPKIMSEKPVETNFANTIGTANTLILAKEKRVSAYMFISSREIYGEPNDNQELFLEDGVLGQVDHLNPRNSYAEGKKAAENMCASFKEEYGLNTKIVRLAHTYGPGMSLDDGRVQADFLNNIIHNQNILLKSEGLQERTYTYISDAIKAMLLVLLQSHDLVYNVASDNSKVSIKELAETLINLEPEKKLKLVFDIPKEQLKGVSSFKKGILSIDKIKNEFGFKPKYDIREGFTRTIKHLKEEMENDNI